MDVFGMDTTPDDEIGGGTGSTQSTPNAGSWFQRGSASDAALSDRGVGVPINAMLDRVRESDGLPFEDEEEEEEDGN